MPEPDDLSSLTVPSDSADAGSISQEVTASAMGLDAITHPLLVESVDGEVSILGPGRLAGSLSPDAAEATAARLQDAAQQARTRT